MNSRDKEEMRRRIAELTERRKREAEARKNANRESRSNPRVTNPQSPPRSRTNVHDEPQPNRNRMYTRDDSSDDETIPRVIIPRAHLDFHGRMPEPPKIDTTGWTVGRETRKLHMHPDKTLTGEISRQQSNLDHMVHIADRQFDDARHHRETLAKMHMESEKRMYEDMEQQRKANEEIQRRHQILKWKEQEQKRIAEAKALSETRRQEYLDKELERNAKFKSQLLSEESEFKKVLHNSQLRMAEQKAQWERERAQQQAELARQREEHEAQLRYQKQQHEAERARMHEEQRERELAFQREVEENKRREQVQREEMHRQRQHERAMRESEAQAREQQNLQEQYMAQMEYGDRARHRAHQRDMELGTMQLANADRNAERQYNLAQTKLVRASELADVYDRVQNGIQQRAFNAMAFHDSRVGKHRNYVKLDKEQRGIDREVEVRDIFDAFDMGDPDMLDLTERRITHPIRLLKHSNCHSYLHTYLFTGVDSVIQKPGKDPYVLFMDGSRKEIPSWADGYAIQPRSIRPHVWIMDVYKVSLDMVDKPRRRCKRDRDSDSDDDFDFKDCCKRCRKLCDVQ